MPIRTIIHRDTEWTIWNVVPSLEGRLRIPMAGSTGGGWLCFQSASEKRRIVPVPEGWEDWPDQQLTRLLESAPVVNAPPQVSREQSQSESESRSELLREQVDESMRRARELGDRVSRAMQEGGAEPATDWIERGPDEMDDR